MKAYFKDLQDLIKTITIALSVCAIRMSINYVSYGRLKMEITRSSDEYRTIAELVYESVYMLENEDTGSMTRFNDDMISDGRWGRFPCNVTARDNVEEVFGYVYNDYHHYAVPDVGCSRSDAAEAIDEDMPDYLPDLCQAFGYYVEDLEEVEDGE
tara:strand:+ start:448 stop:912 length:465 start_codon:yes stop_codon:yes gene_type:complete